MSGTENTRERSLYAYPLRIATHIARLPKYIDFFEGKNQVTESKLSDLSILVAQLTAENIALRKSQSNAAHRFSTIETLDNKVSDLMYKLSSSQKIEKNVQSSKVVNATVSDNHAFDNFYKKFEDKFRGNEETIKERVSEHLPFFKKLSTDLRKLEVVDIGCGRGEFISMLTEAGFSAVGVDMNGEMVERAKKLGLRAEESDAQSFLGNRKNSSLAAITGFHIVEHIPFEALMEIFSECYRTVSRGGFVLFETPNPRSLMVGANTFYLDPSHQRPVPSELLSFMLDYAGFQTEVVPLHRLEDELASKGPLHDVYESIFGFGDYAVIGRKI
ncbi:MAG: class I SAM-dependent methyltransferase [Candidatus Saccharimonadales bacterium]